MRSPMSALLPLIAAAILASPAAAQDGKRPERYRELIVFGNDPCPVGSDGEIVVCARRPESERYRIPEKLRPSKIAPAQGAWSNKVAVLDAEARRASGQPNSCSPIGSGGQSGCTRAYIQAERDRARLEKEEAAVP
jgi:hypothetical protein